MSSKARRRPPAYRNAIAWLALNDEPGGEQTIETIGSLIGTMLVADLWEKPADQVAADILAFREQNGIRP